MINLSITISKFIPCASSLITHLHIFYHNSEDETPILKSFRSEKNLVRRSKIRNLQKNTGSSNRKSKNCHICGRSASLVNFVRPRLCGFAICGPPTFEDKAYSLQSVHYMSRTYATCSNESWHIVTNCMFHLLLALLYSRLSVLKPSGISLPLSGLSDSLSLALSPHSAAYEAPRPGRG